MDTFHPNGPVVVERAKSVAVVDWGKTPFIIGNGISMVDDAKSQSDEAPDDGALDTTPLTQTAPEEGEQTDDQLPESREEEKQEVVPTSDAPVEKVADEVQTSVPATVES